MSMKNFKMMSIACTIGVILGLLFSVPSFASLGKIAGKVTDEATGEALAGAQIQIVGTTMGAAADPQGQYFILNVPPGTYTLRVSFMGYTTQEITDVRSQLDVTTTVDVALKQTVIEGEIVSVIAERPVVDKTMTATRVTFETQELDNKLPLTNLEQILNTSVTSSGMRGGIRRDVAYLLDGVDITDKYLAGQTQIGAGYSRLKTKDMDQYGNQVDDVVVSANMSELQEVSVVAGTFNAEYYASGGVVNLATRSGTQNFSGKAFFRSSLQSLEAAGPSVYKHSDWYFSDQQKLINQGDPTSLDLASRYTWTESKYPLKEGLDIDGEVSLGGPLTSNGNFYFTGRYFHTNGLFPTESRRTLNTSLKANYSLTPSDKLTGYISVDDGGKLLGWKNRTYSYMYTYYPAGNPLNQRLGLLGYLKLIHTFNPSTFVEIKLASLNSRFEAGFVDPNNDGIIEFDETDGDFIILDTVEKSKKYLPTDGTGWFHPDPGNDQSNQAPSFRNQIRVAKPAFAYSKLNTDNFNVSGDIVSQVNFNHQLKAGINLNYRTVDLFTQATSISRASVDPNFPFDQGTVKVHPWDFGSYLQDRIEFKGIIVNAGVRLDGYNVKGESIGDLFNAWKYDTLSTGAVVAGWNRTKKTKTHVYLSPRLGISHPITDNSSMHYSWGYYTTPPNLSSIFTSVYEVAPMYSLAGTADPDPDPVRSTAYEIGIQSSFLNDYGIDLTAYYRDSRNSGGAGYNINEPTTVPVLRVLGYSTSGGYSDSRGLELNIWKRPSGIFSGRLSFSYAYTKSSIYAGDIALDPNKNTLTVADVNYNFDDRFLWTTYASGQNLVKAKLTLFFNLPFDIQIASYTNYNSPWRFTPTGTITDQRYRVFENGDYFVQSDLRVTKYVSFANMRAAVFFEGRNIFDRVNVLRYANYFPDDALIYELTKNPYGSLDSPIDASDNPIDGIPRQFYAGIEFYF
jgi:hypothetical protein